MIRLDLKQIFNYSVRRYSTQTLNNTQDIQKNFKKGDSASVIRTITDNDVTNFAKLTGDYNTIHTNCKEKIVHGALLNGLVSGVLGMKLPGPGTIVLEQKFRFPQFCYVGESVEVKVQITSARKIIECEYSCITNEGKVVLEGHAKLIMRKIEI